MSKTFLSVVCKLCLFHANAVTPALKNVDEVKKIERDLTVKIPPVNTVIICQFNKPVEKVCK